MNLTDACKWVETRLDEGAWFRRAYVVAAFILVWKAAVWSFAYATASKLPGLDTAAVIAAVNTPPSTMMGFAFKHYLGSRDADT